MLTRSEILTMPAEQLAEVSAKMMGWEYHFDDLLKALVAKADDCCGIVWKPQDSHGQARWVADWGINEAVSAGQVETALSEVMGDYVCQWAWEPEDLTRAILLAFVDNGGEI